MTPAEALRRIETGHRLRQLREARQLTGLQLAGLAGCSASHISNIERGHSPLTDDTRTALALALDVPVTELEVAS